MEEGGKRWSKPHVASLSFHYVMEMRKCLLEGAFLVDAEAYSMSQVIGEYRQTLPITYNNMRLVFGTEFLREGCTLRASLSGTFLQTLPELVTPVKTHSLFPRSCPPTVSAPSGKFQY